MKINHLPFLSLSLCLVLGSLTVRAQTGIGTATPTSTLQVVGSLAGNYATVTATTYALGISDYYVSFGAGATAASTFSLPMAALAKGRIYYLKNDNATYAVTVSPNGSETIDGSATVTVPAGQTIQLVSTGSASGATWEVVGFANSTAIATAAPTASNGLTKTGPNTVLGGALTQATNIPLGNNSLTFSTGTTGTGVLVFDGQGIAGSTTNTAKQRIEFTSNGDPNAVIGHTVAAGTVENNDLFLYAGNDANGSYGPDRIRLVGENILFQSFNNTTTSTVANAESNTSTNTNMLISSDGKVGIGTITPAASLDVNGVAIVRNGLQVTSATGPLVSITTTTAAVGSVPAYNNVVYDVAGDENHIFGGNVVSYTDNKYSLGQSNSRWTALYAVNGTIQTSDRRLKTNILNSAYGLGAVMKMRPVTYNWKTAPTSNPMIGFIAQEMESIVPEAVDVPKTVADHYGMKYNELIPVLTKAIQEQQAQIEQLTAANASLRAELKAELAGKASASILSELQAALQSLRAQVQGLSAASQTASSSTPR